MTMQEKSAYLKGLAEGLQLDEAKPETKLINAMIELLGEVTGAIDEIDDDLETLNDYIEEIDEDLGLLEEECYGECDCGCDDDCDCGCCDDDDCDCGENMMCAMCPGCGSKICFDGEMDPDDVVCPNCGKALCDDECDCGCCDGEQTPDTI